MSRISQIGSLYIDCNVKQQTCTIGEFKNDIKNINRKIDYSEIKGYYVYNSPSGYFSVYDRKPQTSFALKIEKNNKKENIILPFIGRVDWVQADNDIFKNGINIKQDNHYKLFYQILSVLCFLLFILKVIAIIVHKNKNEAQDTQTTYVKVKKENSKGRKQK